MTVDDEDEFIQEEVMEGDQGAMPSGSNYGEEDGSSSSYSKKLKNKVAAKGGSAKVAISVASDSSGYSQVLTNRMANARAPAVISPQSDSSEYDRVLLMKATKNAKPATNSTRDLDFQLEEDEEDYDDV